MRVPRIYSGPDGQSRMDHLEIDGEGWPFPPGKRFALTALRLRRGAPGEHLRGHPARQRHIAVTLCGEADLTTGDGKTVRLRPGSAVLIEDTTGTGHETRSPAGVERISVSLDLEATHSAPGDGPLVASGISYPTVYTDDRGKTHFRDVWLDAPAPKDGGAVLPASIPVKSGHRFDGANATRAQMDDWHVCPRPQFIITLSGAIDVETSDGEVRHFGPGSVFLLDDMTGDGHRNRLTAGGWRVLTAALG